MPIRWIVSALAATSLLRCANSTEFCQPSPELQAEFQNAAALSAAVTEPFAALDRAAPFLVVRDRHPGDLFAHERYQDAMHDNGIEGHLRLLTRQYKELQAAHPNEPMYRYLALRATVGRSTRGAVEGLNTLLAEDPAFAPAHRTLAEIYGTEAFSDTEKERSERETFLTSCPGAAFTRRPPPIPDPSPLINQAELLFAESGDPDRIIEMTMEGLREFEWRSQRIRVFDWYTREYKIEDARQLRAKYWQAWPIQVRCHRRAGRTEEANRLLSYMAKSAAALRTQPGPAYQEALDTLARLTTEKNESRANAGTGRAVPLSR
jgi:hypothetical protein